MRREGFIGLLDAICCEVRAYESLDFSENQFLDEPPNRETVRGEGGERENGKGMKMEWKMRVLRE